MRFGWLWLLPIVVVAAGCGTQATSAAPQKTTQTQKVNPVSNEKIEKPDKSKVVKSDAEWRKTLTPEQYHILREKGTERAFTGAYWNHHEDGTYVCAGCGQELFSSDKKFDSGTGWPSFWDAMDKSKIEVEDDYNYGMHRIEVKCSRCGGHLGHVFDDGPPPTGQRYCINSACLKFKKK